ncbi:MAG: hypothetical protein N2117_03740 [Anaerolineales bacterium]|nr:hypothetical protein [Anaerolineales bacterium]MCX7754344.1 hypothetical protein [Anaerolineales bacterium]MDW8279053.1 hypothetical protein [Anaerolineales bacterium]
MSLVNVFTELVVTGFHAVFWIGLIVLAFTGYQGLNLEKLATLNLALPIFVLTYILGVIVDKLADLVFIRLDKQIREKYKPNNFPRLLEIRFYILSKSKDVYEQLEYARSRMRIARAATVNFAFTTIAALVFIWSQLSATLPPEYRLWVYLATLTTGTGLSLASYRAWLDLNKTYISSAVTAYNVLRAEHSDDSSEDDLE